MLTGQNINYTLLPLGKFVLQEAMSKKKKKKEKEKEKHRKEKKPQPNKNPKIAISVACILIRCQPLFNNISIENGKNDIL